ncbi:methyl-accepting chemotaxis protein [Enterovibrio sp. ZSDZ42]|uniref:Methyl-accepting chemotaxis protein n=1 Tax=Enterovibrio gelatinilyticus TaxID=2899819 RepID=A0ABT5R5A1_9GAMM|nr:methyl-accepting chemotaxis protein [Enterovibrio sp. ZSDZ42]MDD1795458.1 methyl-accepting chemotaxis protein [Enterovibrio sp. ZSDZ42]
MVKSGASFIARLSVKSKIGIVVTLLILTISYLMLSAVQQHLSVIRNHEKELQGLQLVWPIYELITPIQQVRGNTNRYLNGEEEVLPAIRLAQRSVDEKIAFLFSLANDASIKSQFDVTNEVNLIRLQWETLKNNELVGTPDEVFQRYTDAVQNLRQLLTSLSDKSGLSFDSEATSAYLIDLSTNFALQQQEIIGITRGKGSGMLAKIESGDTVTNAQLNNLTKVAAGIGMSEVAYQLKQAFLADPRMDQALRGYSSDAQVSIEQFSKEMLAFLSSGETPLTSKVVWSSGTDAIEKIRILVYESLPWIRTIVEERIAREYNQFYWLLFTSSLAVFIALSFAVWILADLKSKYEEEKRQSSRLTQIKQALDNVKTSVIMANTEHDIVYINDAASLLFNGRESGIRECIHDFRSDKVMGSALETFAPFSAFRTNILNDMTHSHTEDVELGNLHFTITVIPVFDKDKSRIGTVIEWQDRTNERMSERDIKTIINQAKNGELSSRIEESDKDGFFLYVAQGLNELMDVLHSALSETVNMFDALSHGRLEGEISGDYQGTFQKLQSDANNTIRKLDQVVVDMRQSASGVSNGAEEIAAANQDLSQRTEEQSSNLEETAASLEQMTQTLKSSSDNATRACELARSADIKAKQGGHVVSSAVNAMSEINQSSRKIAEIISVIDVIAFQTNLLALNASVEAARAGDQGRGFAVVAGEVRSLAQRSATAAKEIKTLIEDSVQKVELGSELINRSGDTLEEIQKAVSDVNTIIVTLSENANEQAFGIQQVNTAVNQMDAMTQQNATMVEETATASATMASQARYMLSLLAFFSTNEEIKTPAIVNSAAPKENKNTKADEDWGDF